MLRWQATLPLFQREKKQLPSCHQGTQIKKYVQDYIFRIKPSPIFLQNSCKVGTATPRKPGCKELPVATPDVVKFVEYCKVSKPSTRTSALQQGLFDNAICTPANLAARSTIYPILKGTTWKKLSVRPAESLTAENVLKL